MLQPTVCDYTNSSMFITGTSLGLFSNVVKHCWIDKSTNEATINIKALEAGDMNVIQLNK